MDGEILIDARGHRCPVPTLKLRRALAAAPEGARLRLLADDPMARIDVPHFLREIGASLVETAEAGGALAFVIVKSTNGIVSSEDDLAKDIRRAAPKGTDAPPG
jgi:tRNA 2-thiouridine synthesizing protein A